MKISFGAIACLLLVAIEATPVNIFSVEHNGGRRYQGVEQHNGPITDPELDGKSKQFHDDVQDRYKKDHPDGKYPPNMVSAQKHGDNIFYSSTERVDKSKKDPKAPALEPNKLYQDTQHHKTEEYKKNGKDEAFKEQVQQGKKCVEHRAGGQCSEGGTTHMVQTKHPNDSQKDDKISSYGTAVKPGQGKEPVTGHHAGCTSNNDKKFGCTDAIDHGGLHDTNAPKNKEQPKKEAPKAGPSKPAEKHDAPKAPQPSSPKPAAPHVDKPTISAPHIEVPKPKVGTVMKDLKHLLRRRELLRRGLESRGFYEDLYVRSEFDF